MITLNLELLGMVSTVVVSIIALILSWHSNKISKQANLSSEKANKNTVKDYMPILKIKEIIYEEQSIDKLCETVTFDFDNIVNDETYYELQYDSIPTIKLLIENIGDGLITNLKIMSILICKSNKTYYERCMDENEVLPVLVFYESCCCQQSFILSDSDSIYINLLFDDLSFYQNRETIGDFLKGEVMILLNVGTRSINSTTYEQSSIWCNFVDGKAVLNSFDDVLEYNQDKLKLDNRIVLSDT